MKDMLCEERCEAQVASVHLTEENNEARTEKDEVAHNGKPMREWLSRKGSASPTALSEGTFLQP